jgi:hypothetical protein
MRALAAALRRLSIRRLYTEFYIRPDGRAAAGALGKDLYDNPDFDFPYYRCFADLACSGRSVALYFFLLLMVETDSRNRDQKRKAE